MSDTTILLDHGSGGLASQNLIQEIVLKYLNNPILGKLEDSSIIDNQPGRLVFSTDSYVVDPLFFPGGDIGKLAVHGTINDLAMRGAQPLCLSLGLILEEGFPLADFERILQSIAEACQLSGVPIVTGDTKVVPKGKADKIFINTSGIGTVAEHIDISSHKAQAGDSILLSGTMGDHGITIMSRRAGLGMHGDLQSDSQSLHVLVARLVGELPGAVHSLRDPTRGGVATSLHEIAANSSLMAELNEQSLPVKTQVRAACELLGLDPLYLANEGKCLVIVAQDAADKALALMRSMPEGRDAVCIGRMAEGKAGRLVLKTALGGSRLISPLHGEPLPRIC